MLFLVLFFIVISLVYYVGTKNYNYWKDKGVPGPKPRFFVGNIGWALTGKKSLADVIVDVYRKYEGYSFVGMYKMGTPVLLIRDTEFIKRVLIKDFKHFQNNEVEVDKSVDRIIGRNPFVLKGNEWKQKRAALTQCFTSGKIKGMFPILEEVSRRMVKYIEENSFKPLEAREVCMRFTLDNVGACAFGVEAKCFEDDDAEFRKLANDFLSPGSWSGIVFFIIFLFPKLSKVFKVRMVRKDVEDRLISLVGNVLKHRRENNIVKNDFLEYVNELRSTTDLFPDEIDIVAQAATFFADGYETSSRVMSFVLYDLATHSDAQEKLRKEINSVLAKHDNKLTYDAIQEMPYLDACFYESMRKNPLAAGVFKKCTERYTYTCTDPEYKHSVGTSVTLEPDDVIFFSFSGMPKDEKYFDKPNEYIPERFVEKENINKFAYMPFGEGPRSCLGARFAITQIKIGLVQIVRNFRMTLNGKTQLPLKFDPWYIMLEPIGGLWIDFEKVEN